MQLMAMRRRKTLVIDRPCHENVHVGRTAASVRSDHWRARRREPAGGVREEADGKRPWGTSPAANFTLRGTRAATPPASSPNPRLTGRRSPRRLLERGGLHQPDAVVVILADFEGAATRKARGCAETAQESCGGCAE